MTVEMVPEEPSRPIHPGSPMQSIAQSSTAWAALRLDKFDPDLLAEWFIPDGTLRRVAS